MLDIKIVPQKNEFGCAKAVMKTIIKTIYGREVESLKDHFLSIKSLGTISFLGLANDALREHGLSGHMIKRANSTTKELRCWIEQKKLMVVIFISKANYPHYAIVADIDDDFICIANTQGAKIEKFPLTEFVERWYLNPRYVNHIQWMYEQENPVFDRMVRWGIKLSKLLYILRPGTVFILEQ